MSTNRRYQGIHSTVRFGSKLGLERIRRLMVLLGNPKENANTCTLRLHQRMGSVAHGRFSFAGKRLLHRKVCLTLS